MTTQNTETSVTVKQRCVTAREIEDIIYTEAEARNDALSDLFLWGRTKDESHQSEPGTLEELER